MAKTTTTLDAKTIDIVKSTVPILEKRGEEITKRFYQLMFSNHPELLNVFNHANQKKGRQPRALAASIYAAAAHIDNLEAILPVVKQIGHKHRSLEVKPEQYPIVGKHLLLAIKDVLGDAATDEVIEAWRAAYDVIADVFIQVEREMYEQAARKEGGWNGFREFIVDQKVKESEVITSFFLKAKDGLPISEFAPGQYISVRCRIPGEKYTHIRQYSLSDAPGKDYYRISVKRETAAPGIPDGIVSNFLHDDVHVGDTLEVTAPAGDFTLNMESNKPVVLISGGVGLTPLISMLNTIAERQPGREVTFIHAAINSKTHAMHEHVKRLADESKHVKYYVCYEKPLEEDRVEQRFDKQGYIDLEFLQKVVPDKDAEFYFCGPIPFMRAIYQALQTWGVSEQNTYFEFFGPKDTLK